jgi:hypothetical protein
MSQNNKTVKINSVCKASNAIFVKIAKTAKCVLTQKRNWGNLNLSNGTADKNKRGHQMKTERFILSYTNHESDVTCKVGVNKEGSYFTITQDKNGATIECLWCITKDVAIDRAYESTLKYFDYVTKQNQANS